jgi:hypothetical protein
MEYKAEMRMVEKVLDVLPPAGNEIIETDDLMAFGEETVTEMGTQKTSSARHQG